MIEEKLKRVPKRTGIYLLINDQNSVLYVGKARILKNRLRSHFHPGKKEDLRHKKLMAQVKDFEIIVTDSEIEALILEANIVKEKRPKYNINLKDDKSYPYIRVTNETYPRIFVTRKIVRDGSRYYGPYTDVTSIRQLIGAIRRIFPLRICKKSITDNTIKNKRSRVCLNYDIGRCLGPCQGLISQENYTLIIKQVVGFIQGRSHQILEDLENRMKVLSSQQRFEEAAKIRDVIRSIDLFHSKQKVVDNLFIDRDIITVASDDRDACAVVFIVREGKIVNRKHFYLEGVDRKKPEEILTAFTKQYYLRTDFIPSEIYFYGFLSDMEKLKIWLTEKKGSKVDFVFPKKGKKAHLMVMCKKNAELLLSELQAQKESSGDWVAASVKALQMDLNLQKAPKHIESFDISNIHGQDAVASMVVFKNGKPKKSEYRKFRIKTVEGIDDFRMMAEVIERRMRRLIREDKNLPDLILVDGGKGQLSAAVEVLQKLSIKGILVIGLAKRLEEVYIPDVPDPQNISKSSPSLHLLQRIRDEAHRFAVQYHRTLRRKRAVYSILDKIDGIGEKRRSALLKRFGSVEMIRNASVDEIADVKEMNRKIAKITLETLKKESDKE